MAWLSEKNQDGKTGKEILKGEFARVGRGLMTRRGLATVAVGGTVTGLAASLITGLFLFSVHKAQYDSTMKNMGNPVSALAAAWHGTNLKEAVMIGFPLGAGLPLLSLPLVAVSESKKKWNEGNGPSNNAGPQ